jgi:hypothetical protein
MKVSITERLRIARDGLAKLENAWRERMVAALEDQRRLVAELEAEAREGGRDDGRTQ